MRETEITVQIFTPLSQLRERLERSGFICTACYRLEDHYFFNGDFALAKAQSYETLLRRSVLIRTLITDAGQESVLCYKDKTVDKDGTVVSEEKTKTAISDPAAACSILSKAGLSYWCELVNETEVYTKGETEFAIQCVDGLGIFLEYEEEAGMAAMEPYEKLRRMKALVQTLGLKLGEDYSCKKPYMKWKRSLDEVSYK